MDLVVDYNSDIVVKRFNVGKDNPPTLVYGQVFIQCICPDCLSTLPNDFQTLFQTEVMSLKKRTHDVVSKTLKKAISNYLTTQKADFYLFDLFQATTRFHEAGLHQAANQIDLVTTNMLLKDIKNVKTIPITILPTVPAKVEEMRNHRVRAHEARVQQAAHAERQLKQQQFLDLEQERTSNINALKESSSIANADARRLEQEVDDFRKEAQNEFLAQVETKLLSDLGLREKILTLRDQFPIPRASNLAPVAKVADVVNLVERLISQGKLAGLVWNNIFFSDIAVMHILRELEKDAKEISLNDLPKHFNNMDKTILKNLISKLAENQKDSFDFDPVLEKVTFRRQ